MHARPPPLPSALAPYTANTLNTSCTSIISSAFVSEMRGSPPYSYSFNTFFKSSTPIHSSSFVSPMHADWPAANKGCTSANNKITVFIFINPPSIYRTIWCFEDSIIRHIFINVMYYHSKSIRSPIMFQTIMPIFEDVHLYIKIFFLIYVHFSGALLFSLVL